MQFSICVVLVVHAVLALVLLGGITHRAIASAALVGPVVPGFAVTLCFIAYINVLLPYTTKT